MEIVQVPRYKTVDGILFEDENQAKLHEIRLLQVKVFEAYAYPDRNNSNELSMIGYIYVNAKANHEMYAKWFMGQKYGNQIGFAYNNFGSQHLCINWEVREAEGRDNCGDKMSLVRIEDALTSRIWEDSITSADQVAANVDVLL